jgi:hypothetical protein
MHLIVEYPFGMGNQGFQYVFDRIFLELNLHYPNITKKAVNVQELFPISQGPATRSGTAAMKITNDANRKTTLVSFWDRTLEMLGHEGWEMFDIVHIIGGLGVYMTPEQIMEKYNAKFTPFLYPLEFYYIYDYIKQFREPYDPTKKIRKACFIGGLYESRRVVADILRKHPLFDVYGREDGYFRETYFQKMNEYTLTLSLNGAGEWCVRDFESMGLGIPIIRSEALTPMYKGLYPGQNYIAATPPSDLAFMIYPGIPLERIAEYFIDSVEKNINNDDLLMSISRNNIDYYDKYLLPNKIVDEFFKVFDPTILE